MLFLEEETILLWRGNKEPQHFMNKPFTFSLGRSQEMQLVTCPFQGGISAVGRAPHADLRLEMVHGFIDSPGKHYPSIPSSYSSFVRELHPSAKGSDVLSAMCLEGEDAQLLENTSDVCLHLSILE